MSAPPTLPGEAWRGRSMPGGLDQDTCAVVEQDGRIQTHFWDGSAWRRVFYSDSLGLSASIMGAWALHLRERAEKAERERDAYAGELRDAKNTLG